MADFDPDAYLAGTKAQASTVPVDQTQLQNFDPDNYLNKKNSDSFDANQAKYGGIGNELLAGLAGAARGASLGLSDVALTKSGAVNAETLAGLKKANPLSSFGGNVLGGGALIGATGGLASPVEAGMLGIEPASIAAKATAEALEAGSTDAAAELIGQKAVEAAVKTAADQAGTAASYGARAVGWGVEGAGFGAGNAVSDYALGDPNLSASKVLTDVGMGALFGALSGVAVKGIGQGASALFSKKVSDIANAANATAEASEALEGSASGSESSSIGGDRATHVDSAGGFLTNQMKENAPELLDIQEKYGYPVTKGMLSNDPWVQKAEDALANGAPTYMGVQKAAQFTKGWNMVTRDMEKILDTGDRYGGGALTKRTLGEELQASLTKKIEAQAEPAQKIYEAIKPHMQVIETSDRALKAVSKNILELPGAKTSFAEGSLARRVAKDVLNLDSADAIKEYKSSLNGSVSSVASIREKMMVKELAEKLTNLEESTVMRAAQDPSLPQDVRELVSSLVKQREEANALYKPLIKNINTLTEQLGRKNTGGPGSAIAYIKDLDPETLANKLFDRKYSKFNDFMQENFKDEFNILQAFQKQKIREASLSDGHLSPRKLFSHLDKIDAEIKEKIFNPDELKNVDAAHKWVNNLPKNFNPSGTSGMSAFRAFMESPAGAALANARDFAIEAFIQGKSMLPPEIRGNPVTLGSEMAEKFNKLNAIREMSESFNKKLISKVQSAVTTEGTKDSARGALISAETQISDKMFDKISQHIADIASNPNALVDGVAHHMAGLDSTLPNITQGIATKTSVAAQFLNSKLPRPTNTFPLNYKWEPSEAQKHDFMKYYSAVNDPISVLDQVKAGTLSNKAMEALSAVHPELLQQMQHYVEAHMMTNKDARNMGYAQKISISKFLGKPLEATMLPQSIQANQMALSGPQLGTQQAPKMSSRRGSFKNFNPAQRSATQTQELEERKD